MTHISFPAELVTSPDINANDLRCLLYLASLADGDGECLTSCSDAANALQISVPTWKKSTTKLKSLGIIEIFVRHGLRKTTYRILDNTDYYEKFFHLESDVYMKKSFIYPPETEQNFEPTPCLLFINKDIIFNVSDNINAHAHTPAREEDPEELKSRLISQTQWAQAVRMQYGIDDDTLKLSLDNAHAYCLANELAVNERNLKRYAWQALRMTPKEELRQRATAKTPIEKRRERLRAEIEPYLERFGKKTCNEFYCYWTEPDTGGVMRFEKEQFWNTLARLKRFKK